MTKSKEVNPSRVLSFSPNLIDISSLVCRHLKFPAELTAGMEIKLEKVLIYETGDHYQMAYSSKEIGMFCQIFIYHSVQVQFLC